jgi:lactate permease
MLPLLTLFVLLGVLKMAAYKAALIALAVTVFIAVVVYPMPLGQALDVSLLGAAYGLFPIMWIVVNAIWIYNMTVATGHFDVLRRSFAKVSDDQRIQAMIIAFCFGALMEALAGFGTPVAISSVMLIALGLKPMKAAVVALVANTAPVAFGALAVPIVTLGSPAVTGLSVDTLGSMVGRQTPILAVFVPLALVAIVDGARGMRQTWPVAAVCGVAFALAQFICSNYVSVELTDIVASLVSALAVVAFLQVWQPAEHFTVDTSPDDEDLRVGTGSRRARMRPVAGGAADKRDAGFAQRVRTGDDVVDSRADVVKAYAPYLIIIAVFSLAQITAVKGKAPVAVGKHGTGIESVTKLFKWPGLDLLNAKGKAQTLMIFKFNWLSAAGTLLLIAGLITMLVLAVSPARALKAYATTLNQLKFAIVTVMAVLALAYVMNAAGMTRTLGLWMAGAGGAFALISPVLGWLGVAVTGSDTSSNSLFGALQKTAAGASMDKQVLYAAANSSGGVLGKMLSPQNLAIAAGAVGMAGREGDLFRKILGWSLGFLAFMAVLIFLQSTVLKFMIP